MKFSEQGEGGVAPQDIYEAVYKLYTDWQSDEDNTYTVQYAEGISQALSVIRKFWED